MKVGIFAAPDDRVLVKSLLAIPNEIGSEPVAYVFGSTWPSLDGSELQFNLGAITHFVFLVSPAALRSGWLPCVAGFCLGKDRPGHLFLSREDIVVPGYLSRFESSYTPAQLRNALLLERELHTHEIAIEGAQAELTGRGLGLTDDDFCEAVLRGDEDAVKHYLTIGFSPDTRDAAGMTALTLAVRRRQFGLAQFLLKNGAEPDAENPGAGTALFEAAARGTTKILELLIAARADLTVTNDHGQTALIVATGEGQADACELLLDAGCPPDAVDVMGMKAGDYARLFSRDRIAEMIDGYRPSNS